MTVADSLFSTQSMYWRVNREWLIALAGPRALLMELAHPLIAAGVAQHSAYDTDPFGRLYRTMKTMTEISFGDADEASAALNNFHGCHQRVRGQTVDKGIPYDANDPHLQLWVWATLVDSVPRVYERFVCPLTFADKCAYYDDTTRLARMLGLPAEIIPPTFTAFNFYMGTMLYGDTLHVTQDARDIMNALWSNTLRGRFTKLVSAPSISLLPPRLRHEYDLSWNDAQGKNVERIAAWSRRVRAFTPSIIAIHPKAWQCERHKRALLARHGHA
jgi:uncharacterized protein (DUF2236 family)